jgi:FkbM family methyltransferase
MLRRYFTRFPPLLALRLLALRGARRLLEPHAAISYADEGSDRIAHLLLDSPSSGFYVDVGANHPIAGSNTFELYRLGWRGLTIDGSPRMIALQRAIRPRDTAVCAVVSDEERDAVFTEFASSAVSSLHAGHVAAWRQRSAVVAERHVRTSTLASLCREHGVPARFELLSVDVERHDYEVLASHDFDAFRPRLVIVEVLDDATRQSSRAVAALLASKGYRQFGRGYMNAYFLDTHTEG